MLLSTANNPPKGVLYLFTYFFQPIIMSKIIRSLKEQNNLTLYIVMKRDGRRRQAHTE